MIEIQWEIVIYGRNFGATVLEKYGVNDDSPTIPFSVRHSYAFDRNVATAYLRPDNSVVLRTNKTNWDCFTVFATYTSFREWCEQPMPSDLLRKDMNA